MVEETRAMRLLFAGFVAFFIVLLVLTSVLDEHIVSLRDIDLSFSGRMVTIQGIIRAVQKSDIGLFLTLDDTTGSIRVVLWTDTLDLLEMKGIDTAGLKEGKNVTATGTIQIYRQLPELVSSGKITIN